MFRILSFTFLLLFSLRTHASACCTSSSAFGIGRLAIWEQFAIGLNQSFDYEAGWMNNEQILANIVEDEVYVTLRTNMYALVAFSQRVGMFLQIPLITPYESTRESSLWYSSFGDLQTGIRYQAIKIGEYLYVPGFALTAAITIPTGLSSLHTNLEEHQISTGRGVFAGTLGLSFENSFAPWFIQYNLSLSIPIPTYARALESQFAYGLRADANFVFGRSITDNVVLSAVTSFFYEGTRSIDEQQLPLSASYNTSVALATAWRFHPHFTLQGSVGSDLPIPYFGMNNSWKIIGSLGIRYGYF